VIGLIVRPVAARGWHIFSGGWNIERLTHLVARLFEAAIQIPAGARRIRFRLMKRHTAVLANLIRRLMHLLTGLFRLGMSLSFLTL
jgi:hypothetical protein